MTLQVISCVDGKKAVSSKENRKLSAEHDAPVAELCRAPSGPLKTTAPSAAVPSDSEEDMEHRETSSYFSDALRCSQMLASDVQPLLVPVEDSNVNTTIGRTFLDSYLSKFPRQPYYDLEKALASLDRGEAYAVLESGQNVSQSPHYQLLWTAARGDNASNEPTRDMVFYTRDQESRFILQRLMYDSVQKLSLNDNSHGRLVVKASDPVYGSRMISISEFMASILATHTTFTIMAVSAAVSVRKYFDWGTRIDEFPEKRVPEVLSATTLALLFHLFKQAACVLVYMILAHWYDFLPLEGSLTCVILLILAEGLQATTFGAMISSLSIALRGKTRRMQDLTWDIHMYAVAFGAVTFRAASLPDCLVPAWFTIRQYTQPTTTTETLRYVLYRGYGFESDEVLFGFAEMMKWSGISVVLSVIILKIGLSEGLEAAVRNTPSGLDRPCDGAVEETKEDLVQES